MSDFVFLFFIVVLLVSYLRKVSFMMRRRDADRGNEYGAGKVWNMIINFCWPLLSCRSTVASLGINFRELTWFFLFPLIRQKTNMSQTVLLPTKRTIDVMKNSMTKQRISKF
jgi:hypothetical protein